MSELSFEQMLEESLKTIQKWRGSRRYSHRCQRRRDHFKYWIQS